MVKKETLPTAKWAGLYVDGMTVPGGLSQAENIDLLPNGWAKRRRETRTLASTVVVKQSEGFKNMFEFRASSGNRYLFADVNITTTTKVISGLATGTTDYELTWADALTGLTAGTAILPQWSVMQDRAFRVDGTNGNYIFTSNSAYQNCGVTAPAAAPVVASTTGGSITPGQYYVYYTYVKKSGTYIVESNPCPVADITIVGTAINVTIIASGDTSVTHVRLYRTLYGEVNGSAYYDQEVVDTNGVTKMTQSDDTIGDTGITLETDNNAPPTSIGLAVSGNRMFYLTTKALYWSKIEEPEHVPALWYSALDPNDSDTGMAVAAMQNYVLAFKRHKTFMFEADSAEVVDGVVGIARHIVSPVIGCMATNSVQSCGEQNCVMWLSHEGVMKYSGGEITNVSKYRINSIIESMMGVANTQYFVDSAYYGKRYHLLIVNRNAGLDTITDERHLVYNFESDSWTEYKYYDSTNATRYYEVNLAIATDSNKKEVQLISTLQTDIATSSTIYQGDYDSAAASTAATEILNSAGGSGVAHDAPIYSFCDSSDNVYIITRYCNVFKVTSAGAKSCIISASTMLGSGGSGEVYCVFPISESAFYLFGYATNPALVTEYFLFKITTAGVKTESYWVGSPKIYNAGALNATSDIMYALGVLSTDSDILYAITNPGPSQTVATIHDFNTWVNATNYVDYLTFAHNDDDIYFLSRTMVSGVFTGNFTFGILSNVDATPSLATYDTGISVTPPTGAWSSFEILIKSVSEIYISASTAIGDSDHGTQYVIRAVPAGSSWEFDYPISSYETYAYPGERVNPGWTLPWFRKYVLFYSTYFIVCGVDMDGAFEHSGVQVYDTDWDCIYTIKISGCEWTIGWSHLISSDSKANQYIICGHATDNVYKTYNPYWEPSVTMDIGGVLGRIVSNYEDLTVANEKRIKRAYMDTMSEYSTCGIFAIESDFTTNKSIHEDAEAAEPDGAVSRIAFISTGQRTWFTGLSTTDIFNSGTVENWEIQRLDVGINGKKFRYSIEFGDILGSNAGDYYLKPPQFDAQIKGKY